MKSKIAKIWKCALMHDLLFAHLLLASPCAIKGQLWVFRLAQNLQIALLALPYFCENQILELPNEEKKKSKKAREKREKRKFKRAYTLVCPNEGKTEMFFFQTLRKMKVGPSRSAFRSRFQTTSSSCH